MATATTEKPDHLVAAERLVGKLPKKVRDGVTVEQGKGKYTLLIHGNRTVASVRNKNIRLTFGHDGTASSLGELASCVAEAATSRPPVLSKEEKEAAKQAKADAKKKAELAEADDENAGGGE
jgi:hypothetical protein